MNLKKASSVKTGWHLFSKGIHSLGSKAEKWFRADLDALIELEPNVYFCKTTVPKSCPKIERPGSPSNKLQPLGSESAGRRVGGTGGQGPWGGRVRWI